jgi:hypothetical protein
MLTEWSANGECSDRLLRPQGLSIALQIERQAMENA